MTDDEWMGLKMFACQKGWKIGLKSGKFTQVGKYIEERKWVVKFENRHERK